ncbi:protein kinase superfamily protein [Actinidia rufa]|uniref:non-specific serine/threonine protein kinase n=1 Tax=Actinidia rufa TaxID=165716 RepID=A0A7J0EID8_9ERIC|nr:protein kinase superfamily protein [Actinidia rufa]
MSDGKSSSLNDDLSDRTSIFGLRLWVVLGICFGAAIVLVLFLISLWFTSKRKNSQSSSHKPTIPNVSREIKEIRTDPSRPQTHTHHSHYPENPKFLTAPIPDPVPDSDPAEDESPIGHQRIHIEIGKGHRISYPERGGGGSGEARSSDQVAIAVPAVSHLGWGHWGQAEKEFKIEVEAIGRVRHKNLVRLLGYCAEGAHRMLVYEYVDNGNLEQWLHGDVGPCSPLTWDIRMNIILGMAKGTPVDYSRPPGEVNLVEWLKTMVTNRNAEGVLDPKIPEKPSSRALKRALLVALRCVDPSAQKRPKMGHVIHMLEADDFPFRDDRRAGREHGRLHRDSIKDRFMEKSVIESGDSSGYESAAQVNRSQWRKQEPYPEEDQ